MIELNDSNASYSHNGISVFVDPIDADEDIFISSSCVFLSDVVSKGKIRAQYNLTVYGLLGSGDSIEIGGELQCTQLKGESISISGRLTVREDITCDYLFVADDATIGSVYCSNIEVHGVLVATGMVDATGSIDVAKSLVSLDCVQASGKVSAPELVASELSAGEESIGKKSILECGSAQTPPITPTSQSIADSDVADIFDAHSPLAIGVDDCAVFLDKLNAYLCSLDLKDGILHRFLATYAEFFPSYAILNQVIEQITSIIQKTTIDEETWFDDFNICVAALRMIPEWFQKSIVAEAIHLKLLDLLSYQSTHKLTTKSYSIWSTTNYHTLYLFDIFGDDPVVRAQLNQLQERLLSNISLKSPSFKLLFSQE